MGHWVHVVVDGHRVVGVVAAGLDQPGRGSLLHRRGKDEFAASCDEEWLTRGRGNDNLSLLQSSGPDAAETNTGLLQDQALTAGGWRQQNTLAGLMT